MSEPGGNSIQSRTIQHSADKQALKVAAKTLVRAAGGQEAAAEASTRVKRQQAFSDYGLPNTPDFMPIDVVADLEAVAHGTAGYPQVTRLLAARAGFALVALPSLDVAAVGDLHAAIGRYAKEQGEATGRACMALADGKFCAADAHAVIPELDDAIEAAVTLRALLNHIAGEG
jgi:hypothetical protein